jgi:hypothetical protein
MNDEDPGAYRAVKQQHTTEQVTTLLRVNTIPVADPQAKIPVVATWAKTIERGNTRDGPVVLRAGRHISRSSKRRFYCTCTYLLVHVLIHNELQIPMIDGIVENGSRGACMC